MSFILSFLAVLVAEATDLFPLDQALKNAKNREDWLKAVFENAEDKEKERLSGIFFTSEALKFYQELKKNWQVIPVSAMSQYKALDVRDQNHILFFEYFFIQELKKFNCKQAKYWSEETKRIYSDFKDLDHLEDFVNACLKNRDYFVLDQENLSRESFRKMYLKIFPSHNLPDEKNERSRLPNCESDDISFENIKWDPWLCTGF